MFNQQVDDRLSSWAQHRAQLDLSETPLQDVWDFWKSAPFIPYNSKVDPFFRFKWPSPWEIVVENKYDDFTKALMIAQSLKLTKKFQDSNIDIKILVDRTKNFTYNVVCVDNAWAINFDDIGPVPYDQIPETLIENIINPF